MRFQIYFFSGTGNTWWVAEQFAKITREAGHNAELTSIETKEARDVEIQGQKLEVADFIVFAYPVYASTSPDFVKDYLGFLKANIEGGRLKKSAVNGKKCGVLTSMAYFSGDGALVHRNLFRELGMTQVLALNIALCSNFSIPLFRYNPVPDEKLNKRKEKGKRKLRKAFEKIESGGSFIKGRCPIGKFLGWIQRKGSSKEFTKVAQSIDYNPEKCTHCGLCYENCPTENITADEGILTFYDKCTLCMRCYNFCPTAAIRVLGKDADPKKYLRHKGPKDGFSLEKVR